MTDEEKKQWLLAILSNENGWVHSEVRLFTVKESEGDVNEDLHGKLPD
ncbi:hypothetical protein SAMN05428975_2204 [Mucilaginibacter sp. OK268]|nr:hypothetical protein SAMN05428975_2204 [Mucilaginibacter sp. OK268]